MRLLACGAMIFLGLLAIGVEKDAKSKGLTSSDPATCVLESLEGSGIGDVKYSVLSETDFQAVNGAEWVLLAGQDMDTEINYGTYDTLNGTIGSVMTPDLSIYQSLTNLPDPTGAVFRMKHASGAANRNPSGDLRLGEFQNDAFQGHKFGSGTSTIASESTGAGGGANARLILKPGNNLNFIADGSNGTPRVSSETRPKNITVNAFVKVRRKCVDVSVQSQVDALKSCRPSDTTTYPTECLMMIEDIPGGTDYTNLHNKVACFKAGLQEWESQIGTPKYWTSTCLTQTVANAKRVLIALGTANRTADETTFFNDIVEQYPYYNTIQTTKQ